jgi:hypothetical protein
VLTELLYRWFGKRGGSVLDPFAGGATRGVVAEYLGLHYTGIEIRPGQVEANVLNALECQKNARLLQRVEMAVPTWIVGDSFKLEDTLVEQVDSVGYKGEDYPAPRKLYDFLIACPPYYDLEVYSCSNEDGSSKQTYEEFMVWYEEVFRQAVDRLAWNRFAGIIVGSIRGHDALGEYRDFVEDTTRIFRKLGLSPYNKGILETAKGSLPVRVSSQFPEYRKWGFSHQEVLLFWKGDKDKKAIPAALGSLDDDSFTKGEGKEANEIDA